jgi:hypothetical protein
MAYLDEKWQKKPRWVFNKQGVAIQKYADMVTAGNYYNVTVDMTHLPDFPGDLASYCSTDHDSTGQDGIYMSYRKNGVWYTYDQGVANGDFDYLAAKPAGNPIFRDTSVGEQCETPFIKWIDDVFVLTYQMEGVGNNQSTLRALGTDGVNFTKDKVVLDYIQGAEVGDGHTGYLRWGVNKFPDVPYKYIGYALHGGQTSGFFQLCGCDDPRTDDWVTVAVIPKQRGEIFEGTAISASNIVIWNTVDVDSLHQVGNTWFMLCGIGASSAGAGSAAVQTYWLPMAADGYTVCGTPILAISSGDAYATKAAQVSTTLSDSVYYDAVTDANVRSTAMATIDKESGALSKNIPSTVKPPYNANVIALKFADYSAMPLGVSEVKTALSTINYDDAVKLTTPSDEYAYIFMDDSVTPSELDFIEFTVEGIRTESNPFTCSLMLGLSEQKLDRDAQVTSIMISNGLEADNGAVKFIQRAGGVDVKNTKLSDVWGIGWWNSYASLAPKSFGIRWYPQLNLFYLVGESGVSILKFTLESGISKTKTYYPFIGLKGLKTGYTANHVFSKMTLKTK